MDIDKALKILSKHKYRIVHGFILTEGPAREPKTVSEAIDYLCDEWDYCAMTEREYIDFEAKKKEQPKYTGPKQKDLFEILKEEKKED